VSPVKEAFTGRGVKGSVNLLAVGQHFCSTRVKQYVISRKDRSLFGFRLLAKVQHTKEFRMIVHVIPWMVWREFSEMCLTAGDLFVLLKGHSND